MAVARADAPVRGRPSSKFSGSAPDNHFFFCRVSGLGLSNVAALPRLVNKIKAEVAGDRLYDHQ